MKNILIVTGIYPPDIGGPATFVEDLVQHIKDKNDIVKVITLQDKKDINIGEENIIRISRQRNKFLRTFLLVNKIRKNSRNTDTVLCCGLMLETYLALIGRPNKKIYRFVSDSIWDKYQSTRLGTAFTGKKEAIFLKIIAFFRDHILNSFDLIIAPSQFLKNYYIKNINQNSNLKVINNFSSLKKSDYINLNNNKKLSDNCKVNLITCSRLVKAKNINYLIEALDDLKEFNLHIFGTGPEEDYLKFLIYKNSSKNIFFHGLKKRKEVLNALSNSDCFVQISEYEGMSFSVLEALSFNKPMLLSNIEPNLETAKTAAIYVNPYSINNLKNSIRLLKCPLMRKTIAKNSKKISNEFYDKNKSLELYYNEL